MKKTVTEVQERRYVTPEAEEISFDSHAIMQNSNEEPGEQWD